MAKIRKAHIGIAILVATTALFAWVGYLSTTAQAAPQYALAAADVTIAGPRTANFDQTVIYTIYFTDSISSGGVEYTYPSGFAITNTMPAGKPDPATRTITWSTADLSGYETITITGTHSGTGECLIAVHTAALYDNYDPGIPLPQDATLTQVGVGCHSVFLPATLRQP